MEQTALRAKETNKSHGRLARANLELFKRVPSLKTLGQAIKNAWNSVPFLGGESEDPKSYNSNLKASSGMLADISMPAANYMKFFSKAPELAKDTQILFGTKLPEIIKKFGKNSKEYIDYFTKEFGTHPKSIANINGKQLTYGDMVDQGWVRVRNKWGNANTGEIWEEPKTINAVFRSNPEEAMDISSQFKSKTQNNVIRANVEPDDPALISSLFDPYYQELYDTHNYFDDMIDISEGWFN